MAMKLGLPVGTDNFEKVRTDGFYYVDKTGLIKKLLENRSEVTLFTRPRRFGKSLNMSMLKHFFGIGCDRALFDGLEISREKELCDRYMGKFPVISISLKGVSGRNFDEAVGMLSQVIGEAALQFAFLEHSDGLPETGRRQYKSLIGLNAYGSFAMPEDLMKNSLRILSQLLHKHYGQKAVILIDEYDVPLDKAYHSGYYDDMVELVRGLFGQVLKTNDSLYMAVLTGCLRISKESIFTGLNNFKVYTVKDVRYNEYFGFTDEEVRGIVEYYGFAGQYDAIKTWYDGYRFGELEIYCPWDVVNYCADLRDGNATQPQNYWVNTSSNDIVRMFVDKADSTTRDEIERLIDGGGIKKEIHHELTYRDLDSEIDNLWSLLFTTGYLTQRGKEEYGMVELVIPNREIHWIYVQQIRRWFKEEVVKDRQMLDGFGRAFEENDTAAIEKGFMSYLRKTISIRDTNVRKEMKKNFLENFYHGVLLGLFAGMKGWKVKSNAESGDGYSDISVEIEDREIGIVIELKYAENASFDAGCREAMKQIEENNYAEALVDDGMKTIYKYGIACYKKRCRVVSG